MDRFSLRSSLPSEKQSKNTKRPKLRLDHLEDRTVPATYTMSGTILTVSLDTTGEATTWTAGPVNVNVAGTVAAVSGSGGVSGFVTLSGNNATILPTVTAIIISDTISNGEVSFADSGSINSYSQSFSITLNNTGSTLQFEDGTSTFTKDFIGTAKTVTASATGDSRVSATGVSNVTLNGSTETTLPSFLSVGSNLTVTSAAATGISQRIFAADSGVRVSGIALFTANTVAGQNFSLNAPANKVKGSVFFTESGGGTISSLNWLNASSVAQTPNLSALASLTSVTMEHPNAAINTPAITVNGGGALNLRAFGDITQTGPLVTTGASSIAVLGNSAISLTNVGNNFGSLILSSSHSLQTVAITEANAINIFTADLGRAGLTLNAVAGNITQNAGIIQLPGAGPISTTTAAATTITLSSSLNNFNGTLNIGGTPTTVTLRNTNPLASTANTTLPAGVTTLGLRYDNAPLVLGSFIPSTVSTLTATGLGIYQSAPLVIGTVDANGTAGPVLLDNASNDFGTLRFRTAATGAFDVSINDTNGIVIGGTPSALGSGRLQIVSGTGNITQSSSISTVAGSFSTFKAIAGAVTLTNPSNTILGRVEATVGSTSNLQITTRSFFNLGNITTASGSTATFSATGGSGAFQQVPGTKLNLQGPSSFSAAVGTSNLTNPGNQIVGAISLTTPGTFNVSAIGDITLDAVNSPTLNVTAFNSTGTTGGNISQLANPIIVSGTATFNAGLAAGNVTLNTATNNFGTVGGRVNGAGNFSAVDTNAVVLGSTILANGTLSVSAGNNISQSGNGLRSTGTGLITLKSSTGSTIDFNSSVNEFGGALSILGSPNSVTLTNRGNIDLGTVAPVLGASASLVLIAGKTLTLPTTTLSLGSFAATASKTLLQGTISTTTSLVVSGAATISGTGTFTVNSASFNGDVTVNVPLIFNTTGGLLIAGGVWNQGANTLNVSSGGLTISGATTRFITSGSTAISLGAGSLNVSGNAVFQVGTQATVAETATVTTSGNIVFGSSSLQVGLGATTDRLVQAGTGNITTDAINTQFIGTGVATTPQTVLSVVGGGSLTAGSQFAGSFDPISLDPIPFKAGSDVVIANYASPTAVTIGSGQLPDADGTVTGFLQNGQAYTVTSSLGAAAGLVVLEKQDLAGNDLGLDIVVRNNTAASTLTITPTLSGNNGPGTILIHSISVDGAGSVTINAPLADLIGGSITTQGTLTAATLRNIQASSIVTGGTNTGLTTLTAKQIDGGDINIAGVLTALTAENIDSNTSSSRLIAEKFGTIKVTGSTVQGSPPGDFIARLTTRTTTLGTNVSSVTVAGTLSGVWDVFGDIGSVKSAITDTWDLGASLASGGSGVRNPDGVRNVVTSLDIGKATFGSVNLNTTGNVKALLTTDWTSGAGRFGSIGTLTTKTNTAVGANGNLTVGIVLTGNNAGNAIGSFSIAGSYDMASNQLVVRDGNIGSIIVTKTLSGVITANSSSTSGSITTLSAGTISGLTLDAKRIGTLAGVANYKLSQFGDIGSSSNSFTLRGNDGTTAKNAITTLKAARNLASNTFDMLSGNIGSVTASYRSSSNIFNLLDSTAGRIGSFTVGDSSSDSFTVESIGAITSKGVPASAASTTALLGNLSSFNLKAYRESGTVAGVGKITAAGALTSANISAPNGISGVTIGRNIATSIINTDSPLTGNDVIGRIGGIRAGVINSTTIIGESIGSIVTTGFLTPESTTSSRSPGLVSFLTLTMKGAGVVSGVAVGAITTDAEILSSTINAPFGITSIAAKGVLSSLNVITDFLPLAPTTIKAGFGKLGSLTGYDFTLVDVKADSIGAIKSSANFGANSRGTISASSFVARNTASTATGITSITTDGNIDSTSLIDSPAGLGSLSVNELIANSSISAGYLLNKGIGSIKAGELDTSKIVTRQLGSFNILGNLDPTSSLGGGITNSFINVFGNNAGVGLGTFTALGTVASSVFDITDGNLTSFTAARLRDSSIQVGARFTKGNSLTSSVVFGATDRTLGTLNLTAPSLGTSPSTSDLRDGAGFRDSYVAAAKYGTVTVTNAAASTNPTTETQGIAFRSAAASSGTVKVGGIILPDNTTFMGPSLFAKTGN